MISRTLIPVTALWLAAGFACFSQTLPTHDPMAGVRIPPGAVRVPENVEAADIIMKVKPHGSDCDMCARVGGTVVLLALISKSGRVEKLSVVSGPDMLKRAVLDAVRQWRYQPYLVNGKPVEVQTTITVPVEWPPPDKR